MSGATDTTGGGFFGAASMRLNVNTTDFALDELMTDIQMMVDNALAVFDAIAFDADEGALHPLYFPGLYLLRQASIGVHAVAACQAQTEEAAA